MRRFSNILAHAFATLVAAPLLVSAANPSVPQDPRNIVSNWSFEVIFASEAIPWTGWYGGGVGFAADGVSFLGVANGYGYASQILTTVPGQDYRISFALSGYG